MHKIIVQRVVAKNSMPLIAELKHWARQALAQQTISYELTLRIVAVAEMSALNFRYRRKKGPTNVLSFPYADEGMALASKYAYLGDIALCAPVINSQAQSQNKDIKAHWAHLVVHGSLHLLGYDHIKEADALIMEQEEIKTLAALGFLNPYSLNT